MQNNTFHFIAAGIAVLAVITPSRAHAQNAVCPNPDGNKIVFMGSSVCLGHLASNAGGPYSYYQSYDYNHKGYVFDYATGLHDRFTRGKGGDWKVSNISVSGNTTPMVMARWKKDLLPQCARYVVYGLSMANEGIIDNPAAYNQFKTNMEKIIRDTRDSGMIPLVVNNYANNDFKDSIYAKIKSMDLLIHGWDVPTINVLGALDDGSGHWAPGYFADGGHPNDKGYEEMAASIVPSLFDALKAGKPRPEKPGPEKAAASGIRLVPGDKLRFVPEEGLKSFTVVVDVRTRAAGSLLTLKEGLNPGGLSIGASGGLVYRAAGAAGKAMGTAHVNDGAWHTLALTHYAATSRTLIYLDAVPMGGAVSGSLHPGEFQLGGDGAADSVEYRNLLFYRSGMTRDEFQAIQGGALLQSSLELYVSLAGDGSIPESSLANQAQSLNTLISEIHSTALGNRAKADFDLNFGRGTLGIHTDRIPDRVRIRTLSGRLLESRKVDSPSLDWFPATPERGIYLIEFDYAGAREFRKTAF